jgi:hypothetical protein
VPQFLVRVSGEITLEQEEDLRSAGILPHDVGTTAAGYGGELDVVLSYVRTSAADERKARAKVAHVLGISPDHLTARPADEGWARFSGMPTLPSSGLAAQATTPVVARLLGRKAKRDISCMSAIFEGVGVHSACGVRDRRYRQSFEQEGSDRVKSHRAKRRGLRRFLDRN